MNTSYAALIGIDWAQETHAIALRDTASDKLEQTTLNADPNAIAQWATQLQQRFDNQPVAICVELSRGALINQLGQYSFLHIYPLNPVTSSRFRKAFTPSGAKDDPTDAHRHLTILEHHRDKLRRWKAADPTDQHLQLICENRRKLVSLQVDLRNKVTAALRDYYPQALDYAGHDIAAPMGCAFLLKWTDLASLKRAKIETVRKFYYAHGSRRKDLIEKRLQSIEQAKPVSEEPALIAPSAQYVRALAKQLKDLNESIKQLDTSLEEIFASHADNDLWKSFPGAGTVLAPRLAIAWGSDRSRYQSAEDMQTYSGVAPVRNASGKRETIFRRQNRPRFLHQTFWEYAKQSTLQCDWARDYVAKQVERGSKRSSAYRSLAFKWQRIMFATWKNGKTYDDGYHEQSLKKSGSPYAKVEEKEAA